MCLLSQELPTESALRYGSDFFLQRIWRWSVLLYLELETYGALLTVLIGVTCAAYMLKGGFLVLRPLKEVVRGQAVSPQQTSYDQKRDWNNRRFRTQDASGSESRRNDKDRKYTVHEETDEEDFEAIELLREWQSSK